MRQEMTDEGIRLDDKTRSLRLQLKFQEKIDDAIACKNHVDRGIISNVCWVFIQDFSRSSSTHAAIPPLFPWMDMINQ